MKCITFILSLLLVAECTHVSTTSPPVIIDGKWEGVYESQRTKAHDVFEMEKLPPIHLIFNFKSDGASLTGNVCEATTSPDVLIPLENGKIKGNVISFKATTVPIGGIPKMTYDFKGKVDGDIIKMTFKFKVRGEHEFNELFYPSRRYRYELTENKGRKLKESTDDDEGERLRDHYWSYESMDRFMFQNDRLNSRSGKLTITRVKE
jgi:hypothetical protein